MNWVSCYSNTAEETDIATGAPTDYKVKRATHCVKMRVSDQRFCNNCPGPDWMKSFTKRQNPSKRIADNVKPARAEISVEDVTKLL